MPSPFPGMDPFLENPGLWPDVHHTLITGFRDQLAVQLRPKYIVRVEERVYITNEADEGSTPRQRVPDIEVLSRPGWEGSTPSLGAEVSELEVAEPVVAVTWFEQEIHEAYLKVIDLETRDVVTFIEILSPANKSVPLSAGP